MLYLVLRKSPLEIVISSLQKVTLLRLFLLVSCKDFYFERDWNKHKVVIRCHMHFYKLFKLNCVLAVCVHNHPVMIKFHTVFFLLNKFPFLKSSWSQMPVCVTSHWQAPTTIVWLTVLFPRRLDWCFILDLPWVSYHQSAIVSLPEQM